MSDDLLPCPFCGAVMVGRDLQDARERWNSRADRMEVASLWL